jgi:hypothetical protein
MVSGTSVLLAVAAVAAPHLALAHYWFEIPLNPGSIPEPLLSILVLTFASLVVGFLIKPFLFDHLISRSHTNPDRYMADWISWNVQLVGYSLTTFALLGRWICPRTRTPEDHAELVFGWRMGLGMVTGLVMFTLNREY